MEAQRGSHDDVSWALEDQTSKKISIAQGYLTTFHTQPVTQQSSPTLQHFQMLAHFVFTSLIGGCQECVCLEETEASLVTSHEGRLTVVFSERWGD